MESRIFRRGRGVLVLGLALLAVMQAADAHHYFASRAGCTKCKTIETNYCGGIGNTCATMNEDNCAGSCNSCANAVSSFTAQIASTLEIDGAEPKTGMGKTTNCGKKTVGGECTWRKPFPVGGAPFICMCYGGTEQDEAGGCGIKTNYRICTPP